MPSPAWLGVGAQLAGYRLVDKLSKAQTGTVFLAVHEATGLRVEIKPLRTETIGDPDAETRRRRELDALTRLAHKNIVRVWAVVRERGADFLIFEHIEGQSLDDILSARKTLRPADALNLHIRVLEGLAAAHDASIIHRDIHPGCIFLSAEGRVVVGGFALARFVPFDGQGKSGTTLDVTAMPTGTFKAPEQLHEIVDFRSDIYAVGTCLYLALCGELPFDGPPLVQVIARAERRPIPLRDRLPDVPPALDAVVMQMLARAPDERFATAHAAAKALIRLL